MIEVELKFELPRLFDYRALGDIQPVGETQHNLDRYFDTVSFDLLKQGVFVRIRDNTTLDFKFNETGDNEHVQCLEYSFHIPLTDETAVRANALFRRFLSEWSDGSGSEETMNRNGLVELARIDKERTLYVAGNIAVSIDQVKGLGDFLEIETTCNDSSQTAEALEKLRDFAKPLNLSLVKVGYVEMWLSRHNIPAYEVGKYHL